MNLSLRTAGKGKCTDPELDVLNVLSTLMEHESMQVRTYVNGTLYSVLVKPSLKARAAEIGCVRRAFQPARSHGHRGGCVAIFGARLIAHRPLLEGPHRGDPTEGTPLRGPH